MKLLPSDKFPIYWIEANHDELEIVARFAQGAKHISKGGDLEFHIDSKGGLIKCCDTDKVIGAFIAMTLDEYVTDQHRCIRECQAQGIKYEQKPEYHKALRSIKNQVIDLYFDFQEFQNKKPLDAANTQEL